MPIAERAWALVKTLFFAPAFIGFFLVYIPWTWAIRGRSVSYTGVGSLRLLGIVPLIVGGYVALRSVIAHAWTGLGTPAPFDPPQRLVVTGFYRYVRNPMYLGATLVILGETTLFGSIAIGVEYAAIFAICTGVFVLAYEEPALREIFGAEYEEYRHNVPRFLPRLTAWKGGR
jgi:protein-S-isoprenylcysteine O-methyltransferase Ste14